MKRTKAFLAALSALCVTFSAMVSVSAADEPQYTTGAQSESDVVQNNGLTRDNAGACIGDHYYEDWIDAMNHVKDGEKIELLQDYTYGEQESDTNPILYKLELNINGRVTLDLNGHTIDLKNEYLSLKNENATGDSALTITDSGNVEKGEIKSNYESISIGKGVTVTLNGAKISSLNKEVTPSEDEQPTYFNTIVNNGGNLFINDNSHVIGNGFGAIEINEGKVEVDGENTIIEGKTAISIFDENSELSVKNGTVHGQIYGITGNGRNSGTTINISGGTISADLSTGIYISQDGTVNISGGKISGPNTALEVVSGRVDITGGSFKCTNKSNEIAFRNDINADGAQYCGAAVALVGRSDSNGSSGYAGKMVINISGGTFTGPQGFVKVIQNKREEAASIKSINITGGTFIGNGGVVFVNQHDSYPVPGGAVYVGENCTDKKFISGGTFKSKNKDKADITPYLADGTAFSNSADGTYESIYSVYSSANKITGTGTYRTALNDGKYDQMTVVQKEFETATNVRDINFRVTIGDKDQNYNYTAETTIGEGTVLLGLIVTDIPENKTVTVELQ